MTRHRTTARGISLLAIVIGLAAGTGAASAQEQPPAPGGKTTPPPVSAPPSKKQPSQLIFPVVGPATYTDDYGDARGRNSHAGNDIMAPKRALAVAAEAGRVKWHTTSWAAGCMLYLYGDSGATYLYIHLNNDVTSGNDNRGGCVPGVAYAKGLKSGSRVAAGQPVGYVGNSGDANSTAPHLHFEIHPGGKSSTNPYPYLRKAKKLLFAAKPGTSVKLTLSGSLAEAAVDTVKVRVDNLRASTGLLIPEVKRTVEVALPPSAQLESATGIVLTRLLRVKAGRGLTVWTEPLTTTLSAQLGEPGAFAAERVVVRS